MWLCDGVWAWHALNKLRMLLRTPHHVTLRHCVVAAGRRGPHTRAFALTASPVVFVSRQTPETHACMLGSGDLRPMQRGVASAILRVARHCPLTRAPAAAAAHVQHSRPLSTTAPWQQACCSSRFAVAHVRTLGLQLSAPMQQLHAPRGQQHPRTQQPAPRSAPACLPAAARRLSSSRSSSRPPLQLARAMPEHDLDAQLIARQAITSLSRFQQQAAGPGTANPPGPHSTSSGTEAPSGAASDAPDERAAPAPDSSSSAATGGLSWEEVQEHKRAAVQQAFLNDSLGFGFSAGGLVFPYYGEQRAQACARRAVRRCCAPPLVVLCVHSRAQCRLVACIAMRGLERTKPAADCCPLSACTRVHVCVCVCVCARAHTRTHAHARSGPGVSAGAGGRHVAAHTAGGLLRRLPHRRELQRRWVLLCSACCCVLLGVCVCVCVCLGVALRCVRIVLCAHGLHGVGRHAGMRVCAPATSPCSQSHASHSHTPTSAPLQHTHTHTHARTHTHTHAHTHTRTHTCTRPGHGHCGGQHD
jgi:hypothetical protein